jgi:uncharacterized protein YcfL
MNKKQLLLIGSSLLLLVSCASETPQTKPVNTAALQQLVMQQKEQEKTATLTLTTSDPLTLTAGGTFTVLVTLQNPAHTPIDSVRSWLTFDPSKLHVQSMDDRNSAFDLALADEKKFDNTTGIVSIGRSSSKVQNGNSLQVEQIVFQALPRGDEATTAIDFYDYKANTEGHTGVYHLVDGAPYNILQEPQNTSLRLTLLANKIKR